MIVVRTKAGLVWNVLAFDTVAVKTADGAVTEFRAADIAEIMVDSNGAQLAVLDGKAEAIGDGKEIEVRALQLVDGETSIPVRLVFPLELAHDVGKKMAEGKIIVAKTMPQT